MLACLFWLFGRLLFIDWLIDCFLGLVGLVWLVGCLVGLLVVLVSLVACMIGLSFGLDRLFVYFWFGLVACMPWCLLA